MPVLIYARNRTAERNLKQILTRVFGNSIRYQDLGEHQILVDLHRGPHIDARLFGMIRLFEFNNPREHFAGVVAAVSKAIADCHFEAHVDKFGDILQAIASRGSVVLVYLNGSRFSTTRFRPHPHPHMRTRGLIIATGPGLPMGGVVRVGPGNELYSMLYGEAGRRLVGSINDALPNAIVNQGINLAAGSIFARLLGATGLISTQDAGAAIRAFNAARLTAPVVTEGR